MIVELHAIQSFPAANLNRDDQGSPKSVVFGGATRARVSSQSWKRAMRLYFQENETGLVAGTRTAQAIDRLAERIAEGEIAEEGEAARHFAEAILASDPLGFKFNDPAEESDAEKTTKQLLFLRDTDLAVLTAIAEENSDLISEHIDKIVSKSKKKGTSLGGLKLPKEAKKKIKAGLASPDAAADVALFGRMIAELPEGNVDAASQVAHAIGTNKITKEIDFYTAVDDLQHEDTEGASMVGEIEFNASCFYRYAAVDTGQLAANLGKDAGDTDVANVVRAFTRAFVMAIPSGKQHSFAANNPPSTVLAVVRDKGAWNLANAFVKPVAGDASIRLSTESTNRLLDEFSRIAKAFAGFDGGAKAVVVSTEEIADLPASPVAVEQRETLAELFEFVGG